ncbi:MAG: LuxR family transcriptional regulator [Spirochaetota bacterium]
MRLTAGSHVLYLSNSMAERLSLFERLITNAVTSGRRIVAVVDPDLRAVFESAAKVARLRARQLSLHTLDDLVPASAGWQEVSAAVDRSVADAEQNTSGWRLDEPESETLVFVDLDRVFERCRAASEMMSIVYALQRSHAARKRCVVEAVTIERVPRSIPTDFFEVHTDWVFSPHSITGAADGQVLDRVSQRVALETPEFRHEFLALARTNPEGAAQLVPRLFADYRRGFLIVDRKFHVRHCSPRAANLLRRSVDEVVDRPLNACIDGVDLVTVKNECARASTGVQSPFVVSWRLAPGNYEPREVTVDALTSEHRPVGYVVPLAPVETARGPRVAYRQLAEEQPPEPVAIEESSPTAAESLSDSLQGTQITRREHEVLLLILNEYSNRDIARHLAIAEVTVKKHLTSIYRKLRITNRSELVRSFAPPHGGDSGHNGTVE